MKLYIVYLRTMENSPEVEIKTVTTSKAIADEKFKEAKAEGEEWMKDVEDETGDWAEAAIADLTVPWEVKPGGTVEVGIITEWLEMVDTEITVFPDEPSAMDYIGKKKKELLEQRETLYPFDEDETIEESTHLVDESVMVDYYFSTETVTVE